MDWARVMRGTNSMARPVAPEAASAASAARSP